MEPNRLVVLNGPLKGREFDIVGALGIGRGDGNGLQLPDPQVSREHAVARQTPTGVVLRDLESGNGTYVGKEAVRLERALAPGDVISMGSTRLRFAAPERKTSLEGVDFRTPSASEGQREQLPGHMQAESATSVYETFRGALSGEGGEAASARMRLAALYEAAQIISSERNLSRLMERLMEQIFQLIPAHNGAVLLRSEQGDDLEYAHVRSERGDSKVAVSSTIVKRALERAEAVLTYDAAADSRFDSGASIVAANISSAICAPIEHQGEVLGVIYVDARGKVRAFEQRDLELLVALARSSATAIRNVQYLERLEGAYNDTLTALANAIEMRDHYTIGHTQRVRYIACELAAELGWSEEKIEECRRGAILHDVGKIAVDNAILSKESALTDEEYAMMKIHPQRGARLMQDVDFLLPLIPYALYHHERLDGKGYPFGLEGDAIPVEGRLIAVADAFDALTSNRPYRKGFDAQRAFEVINEGRGGQFDPDCVDALANRLEKGSIQKVLQNHYESDGRSIVCPFCSTYVRLSEDVEPGDETACNVCRRRVRVRRENDALFGELVAQTARPVHERDKADGKDARGETA